MASELPNLVWPYFEDAEALWEKNRELEDRRRQRGPEHAAKLKAAREKHLAMMKEKRGGN